MSFNTLPLLLDVQLIIFRKQTLALLVLYLILNERQLFKTPLIANKMHMFDTRYELINRLKSKIILLFWNTQLIYYLYGFGI